MSHKTRIGRYQNKDVFETRLQSSAHAVSIISFGAVVRDWRYRSSHDAQRIITERRLVLGFDEFEHYPQHSPSFGIMAGRVANRTCHGRFQLSGETVQLAQNENGHHLHGGRYGLGKVVWEMEPDAASNAVQLSYSSPAGDQGYPCNVLFTVLFTLREDGLYCDMQAIPDGETPVNLAQHNYYNLDPNAGVGNSRSVLQHQLCMDSTHVLPVDETFIPTGDVVPVENGPFDFRAFRTLHNADPNGRGQDHNVVLRHARDCSRPAARLRDSAGEIELQIVTDQPGVQLYTGCKLGVPVAGLAAEKYAAFGGVCLEAQHFPDSLNHPEWPSIICSPDEPYRQTLAMKVRDLAQADAADSTRL